MSVARTFARLLPDRVSYRTLNRYRQGFQVFALAFLFLVPVLNWLGVHWIVGTLYSISIGALDIADPAMAIQSLLLTWTFYVPLLLAAAVPALLALVFGRVFCSWMCPYNTLAEWLDRLEKRLLRRRWMRVHLRPKEANPPRRVYWGIYGALLLAAALVGLPLFGWLSAPGILSSGIAQAILGLGVGIELPLVLLLVLAELAIARRVWCKYACPVGATLSLFRSPRTMRVVRDEGRCTCPPGTAPCQLVCPLGLVPRDTERLAPYCYNCGSCVAACEKTRRGALRFAFGRVTFVPPGEPISETAGAYAGEG